MIDSAWRQAVEANIYRSNPSAFIKKYLPDIQHFSWYSEPERLIKENKFIAIFAPPGAGKSRRFTIAETVYRVAMDRDIKVGIFSKSKSKAANFMTAIAGILKRPELVEAFGSFITKGTVANTEQIRVVGAKGNESTPTISNLGIAGQAESLRLNLIILDDPVDLETASSQAEVNKFISRMSNTFIPRLEPEGQLILIGSRFNEHDGYHWVIKNPLFTTYKLPALNENGESTIPERFSTEQLEEIKTGLMPDEELGDIGNSIWQARYMQQPQSSGFHPFNAEMLRWVGRDPIGQVRAVIDPAYSTGSSSDFTAMVAFGLDGEDIIITDINIDKLSVGHPQRIKAFMEKTHAKKAWIEVNNARTLGNECRQQGLPVIDLVAKGKKEVRIEILEPWLTRPKGQGALLFHDRIRLKGGKAYNELLQEISYFPDSAHDDILDALAHAVRLIRSGGKGKISFF